MKRLLLVVVAALVAAAAVMAVVVRGGLTTSSAKAASPGDGLSGYVVLTNRGPLTPCSGPDCTSANFTYLYVHVINSNALTNDIGGGVGNVVRTRSAVPNAFVLTGVEETILVDGSVFSQQTLTPPPNLTDRFRTSGSWPATVTCGDPITVPCNTVLPPAILPGENTIAFWDGWFHATFEPKGSYVFQFTLHGTINGAPVDLTVNSKSIQMT